MIIKRMTLFFLLGMTSILFGQAAWNTGELSFDYQQFPAPAHTLSLSGDLLFDEVPHEGVGGFELSVGDTSLVTMLAYDLYVSGSDTLADVFAIFMSDSLSLAPGYYTVSPDPSALKLFAWLTEVDLESLLGLLDSSFTLDSLAAFNPYISVTGEFEILDIGDFHFGMNFSGAMISTNLQLLNVSNGSINLWNTLPVSAYSQGSVVYNVGGEPGSIEGILNPLVNPEGVGAFIIQNGDTLTYHLISYQQQSENVYDVYGVMLTGEEADFPLDGTATAFNISLLGNEFPKALPYMMQDVSLDEILSLLESGELPDIPDLTQLYLPAGIGTATFTYTPEGNAELDMNNIMMANVNAEVVLLSTDWFLSENTTSISDDRPVISPTHMGVVGNPFPNPFNSSTILPVQLDKGETISLQLYNVRGEEVKRIEFGFLGSGYHQLAINLGDENFSGGLYTYTLQSRQGLFGSGSFIYLK